MSCKHETEWCKTHAHCETCGYWEGYGTITTGVNDSLIVTYDNCPPDVPTLIVTRKDKYDMTMLNQFQGDEAIELYNKLIGNKKKCCDTCAHCIRFKNVMCCSCKKHLGDIIYSYTVCDDWLEKVF